MIKDQLDLLEKGEMLDPLDLLERKVFKELVVLRANLDLKVFRDPKDRLDLLVPLVKRELEVSVVNLVKLDKRERLEALD